jgi:hypothetical protein
MSFPKPRYYTASTLAEVLGRSLDMIENLTQTGELKSHFLFIGPGNHEDFRSGNLSEDEVMFIRVQKKKFVGRVYKLEDVERFEKEHGMSPPRNEEDSTSSPDEIPIYGIKDIAAYLGYKSYGHLLRTWKEKKCPIYKNNQKKLYAYESELTIWRASQKNK